MKHAMKLFGTQRRKLCAVALAVVIGFVMASCSLLGDEGGNTIRSLSGTYYDFTNADNYVSIRFSGSDFTQRYKLGDYETDDSFTGTYRISGSTLRLEFSFGTIEVWTIVDQKTLQDEYGHYYRK